MGKGLVVILLWTGGVGKNTVAAALALAGASANLETAVITVDPTQRLRDALGLARLGGHPTRIGAKQRRDAGLAPALKLWAVVVDVEGAGGGVVERLVAGRATRRRIFGQPLFPSLTRGFP